MGPVLALSGMLPALFLMALVARADSKRPEPKRQLYLATLLGGLSTIPVIFVQLGLEKASLYAYRHTFLTDALSKGMSADVLAELAGNSAITIARNYSHLSKKRDAMLAAAQNAVN